MQSGVVMERSGKLSMPTGYSVDAMAEAAERELSVLVEPHEFAQGI